jgi:hypothetical protein
MRSPEELARLIVRLFKDDRRTRLLYDESTKHYRLV